MQGFPAPIAGSVQQTDGKLPGFGRLQNNPALEPGLTLENKSAIESKLRSPGNELKNLCAARRALFRVLYCDILEKLRKGSGKALVTESV